jgi:predicted lipid-binding transport protein (Tim44 family)
MTRRSIVATAVIAGIAVVGLFASLADARPGAGGNAGSRGSKTYTAPPSTNTAPGTAAPMQKSITQPGQAGNMVKPGAAAGATAAAATAARPSMMRNLLLGGLMGAGLAMMFGTGSFATVAGFILQTLLIGGLIALAVMFFRRRFGTPAMATASPASSPNLRQASLNARSGVGLGGGEPALVLNDADFSAFERLLCDVQLAYGQSDLKALETRTTPEMLSYFAHELDANRRKGVRNEISGPKLLQGDLSEAWRDGNDEYATVAMRYALIDATVETVSGRLVSGSKTDVQEIVELWTFRRMRGGAVTTWELSAIQQSA